MTGGSNSSETAGRRVAAYVSQGAVRGRASETGPFSRSGREDVRELRSNDLVPPRPRRRVVHLLLVRSVRVADHEPA